MFHTKCAQTTLYNIFGKPWGKQSNDDVFNGKIDGLSDDISINGYMKKWPNYYTTTFIRNPYDGLVSGYHYFKQHNPEHFENTSFDDYIDGIDREIPIYSPLIPLSFYIDISVESIDFIGRFENLYDDIHTLARKFNRKVSNIPHLTKSRDRKTTDYKIYYEKDETIEKVSRLYEKDIKMFDYKF
jgi:hypothetical protein